MKNKILLQDKPLTIAFPNRWFRLLAIVVATPVVLYYLGTRGFIYLKYSRGVYTDYFWYRAPWLLVHVVCGIICTLIGPFQFATRFRTAYPRLHRNLGKTYLTCVALSTLVSFYLVSTARLGMVYAAGLGFLGIVWLSTALLAYIAIRNGNTAMHRDWMIRSYVLTLSFVVFRFIEDIMARMGIGTFVDRKVLMAWACWAVPFFITVVVLEARKIFINKSTI